MSEREIDDLIRPHAEEQPNGSAQSAARGQAPAAASGARQKQKKRDKRDVHGWVVLDKPVGMTSTHAVSVIKRLFSSATSGSRPTKRLRPATYAASKREAAMPPATCQTRAGSEMPFSLRSPRLT